MATKKIEDMEPEVDVIEYSGRKWTPGIHNPRPYYDPRGILFVEVGSNMTVSRGFHQDEEYEIIGRLGADGRMQNDDDPLDTEECGEMRDCGGK